MTAGDDVHVTLRVGAESYALPVDHVVEIADFEPPTPVPGGPRELLGIRNLRGEVLPVFDLAAVLGIAGGEHAKLVVAEDRARRRAGLAIAGVHSVDELPGATRETGSPLLAGAALTEEGLVGVVDVERLFAALAGAAR